MEIFLALLPVATCVGKLVESGLKLSAAEDDMNAASMLLSIISDTAKSVRLRHEQLSEKLNPEQKERIRTTLSRTDHLLGLSKKALNRKFTTSVSGEVGMLALSDRLVWVFRDRGRLITYQTVLDMLHAVLLAISTELATLKTMPDDSEPQSPVDPIYSDPSKSAIVTGLAAYDGTSTMESGDLYSMESKVSIVDTEIEFDCRRFENEVRDESSENSGCCIGCCGVAQTRQGTSLVRIVRIYCTIIIDTRRRDLSIRSWTKVDPDR
jgi:hypothetical protein